MPEYKFDHVHLISPDPDKTADFYMRHFGARLVNRMTLPGGSATFLHVNGASIIISTAIDTKRPAGLEHFGLCTDNIEKSIADLKAAGVKIQMEITEVAAGTRVAFFWAPENVLIELVETK
jgi:lactoylglutathione lyase